MFVISPPGRQRLPKVVAFTTRLAERLSEVGWDRVDPYDVPINTRFSITGGRYNFWVFPSDASFSPTAVGGNPRTEARYGGTADQATGRDFQTGMRLYSADMFIESNAVGSTIMQIHTGAAGAGPIGVRIGTDGNMVNNGSLTVVQGSTVPSGLIDKWFNFKASFDTATLEVKLYINNCLKSTYPGPRGDGNFYFKNGVYFCTTSQNGCYTHFKNIHLYKRQPPREPVVSERETVSSGKARTLLRTTLPGPASRNLQPRSEWKNVEREKGLEPSTSTLAR